MAGYFSTLVFISVIAIEYVYSTCVHDKFDCGNGHCIPINWRCDNETDCKTGADEMNCDVYACSDHQMQCLNGACIPLLWKCDGNVECPDGDDEMNCPPSTTMGPTTIPTTITMTETTTTTTTTTTMATKKPIPAGKDPSCDDFQPNCDLLIHEIDICNSPSSAALLCPSTCHMCSGAPSGGTNPQGSSPGSNPGVTFGTRTTGTTMTTMATTTLPRSTHEPYTTPMPKPDGSGSGCEDLEDNCATLVASVNICGNPEKAMFLCPATCQLCQNNGENAMETTSATGVFIVG